MPDSPPNIAEFTVSELSAALKRTVEDAYGYVRVRGEVSGYKGPHGSGHVYFALKDASARIDAVIWKGVFGRMRIKPEDGMEVVVTGKVTTYPARSNYQIVIETVEPAGLGALMALVEERKQKLAAEGLFDPARKQLLPFLPAVIGVVTSPTGAVIRDIIHRLADRFPTHVLVWPVLVQGEGSAQQVADAVRGFSAMDGGGPVPRPELVIVARGGGSIEDLWSFNEEIVVRAIAECTIPVISAVGHETDTTLADFAADRRAPTPTAAAEMAVPVRAELAASLDELALRKRRAIIRPVALGRERLEARVARLPRPEAMVAQAAQRLDELGERLRRGLSDRAGKAGTQLQLATAHFRPELLTRPLAQKQARLEALERVLGQLDPKGPLRRGYVLVSDSEGRVVKTAAAARAKPVLSLEFDDGKLDVAPAGAAPRKPRPAGGTGGQAELF